MTLFNVGPDGILLFEALAVSALIAGLTWRGVRPSAGIPATLAVVAAFAIWQAMSANATPDTPHRIVSASFHIVPSVLLLLVSRQRWLLRHAWMLVLLGPFVFVGCYLGICEACLKAGVI